MLMLNFCVKSANKFHKQIVWNVLFPRIVSTRILFIKPSNAMFQISTDMILKLYSTSYFICLSNVNAPGTKCAL